MWISDLPKTLKLLTDALDLKQNINLVCIVIITNSINDCIILNKKYV